MTSVIFVHGTGVRKLEYEETFKTIEKKIHVQRPDIKVIPCLWGDELGTRLNANGTSIPSYDETLALDALESEDKEIILWAHLYCEPLYELRLLGLKPREEGSANPFEESPGDKLRLSVESLIAEGELQAKLTEAGIAEVFIEAQEEVVRSDAYNQALQNVSEVSFAEYCNAVARAIVAAAMLKSEQQEKYPPILTDANLRDKVVELLSLALVEEELGIGGWILGQIGGLALPAVTNYVERKRGDVTNKISPMPCDILLYQTRGAKIRDFIEKIIADAEPPAVLITHSLGGIACVDLLIEKSLPQVVHLVTVGSQAPFLYEINALYSLEFGQPLPEHFPQWLNIYDKRDFLSYISGKIFNEPNQPEKVKDVEVISKQPFPRSHGAYWTNATTWEAVIPELP